MSFKRSTNYNVAMKLLEPTYSKSKGVNEKTYPAIKDVPDTKLFFGLFRTFGGTEIDSNGIHTLLDTAKIETWYRSDIKAECRVYIMETGIELRVSCLSSLPWSLLPSFSLSLSLSLLFFPHYIAT